jgi:hypothetical protein
MSVDLCAFDALDGETVTDWPRVEPLAGAGQQWL